MTNTPHTQEELDAFLAAHPNWQMVDGRLRAVFNFQSFAESIEFVNEVAKCAEDLDHHPSLLIDFDKVTIDTVTHDADNQITSKDTAIIRKIEGVSEGE